MEDNLRRDQDERLRRLLTIESFGRGLKDLAAATKVWRDFAESPEAVYREGYAHIRDHWRRAGKQG